MQIKADFTKEQLMAHDDVLFEACHPLEKLNAIADLLSTYPEGPLKMERDTIECASEMIEDAVREIEYLIDISNEQYNVKMKKEAVNA